MQTAQQVELATRRAGSKLAAGSLASRQANWETALHIAKIADRLTRGEPKIADRLIIDQLRG